MSTKPISGLFALGLRPDQYDLPHPRIAVPIVLIVHRAIRQAFEILRERNYRFHSKTEDAITQVLLAVVENRLRQTGEVPGFNANVFDEVTRQRQVENFNFQKIGKSPDLCFKLRSDHDGPSLSSHYALFVECKPVDRAHSPWSHYCKLGLLRFVDGDYAWAMQDALMVAYARKPYTVTTHLVRALKDHSKELRVVRRLSRAGASAHGDQEPLRSTEHQRAFTWPDGKGAATPIRIYHSWHSCD